MVSTSGTAVGIATSLIFNPASGTASFIGCNLVPTIEGTSSGNTTALVVNPTLTATNLTGTNLIASFQSAGTHELDIGYSGNLIWSEASNPAGISYLGAASLAIGNGTAGDKSGTLTANNFISSENGGSATTAAYGLLAASTGMYLDKGGITYNVIAFSNQSSPVFGIGNSTLLLSTTLVATAVAGWSSTGTLHDALDSGISRLNPASLAIGNGTAGDFSGSLKCATVNATSAYQANGTPGVTQTAIAVGTIATIEGIVTTFTGVSDERLKNHAPYTGGLEEILGITPIRFTYNELGQKFGGWDKEHVYVGFSAQNVQKSIPEAIQGTEGEEEYLSFDDRPVIAALCNAIKELTARIIELEKKQ
jgi:hypothetical protein